MQTKRPILVLAFLIALLFGATFGRNHSITPASTTGAASVGEGGRTNQVIKGNPLDSPIHAAALERGRGRLRQRALKAARTNGRTTYQSLLMAGPGVSSLRGTPTDRPPDPFGTYGAFDTRRSRSSLQTLITGERIKALGVKRRRMIQVIKGGSGETTSSTSTDIGG